jgi:hypothetical protein
MSQYYVKQEELCSWQSRFEFKSAMKILDISGDIYVELSNYICNGSNAITVLLKQIDWIRLVKLLSQINEAWSIGHGSYRLADDIFVSVNGNIADVSYYSLSMKTTDGVYFSFVQFQDLAEQLKLLYFSLL